MTPICGLSIEEYCRKKIFYQYMLAGTVYRDLTDRESGVTPARIDQLDKSRERESRMPADQIRKV